MWRYDSELIAGFTLNGARLPEQMRSSMLNDLVAGNRLEAPWLSGAVARMAAESQTSAPVNATMYAAMKPYIGGARS
jgi:2-dehydropantoate 2-reductase